MNTAEHCMFDLHADRNEVDAMLRNGIGYAPILRWLEVRPATHTMNRKITGNTLKHHRLRCLGLPPIEPGKHVATPVTPSGASTMTPPPVPPSERRSARYADRKLTDEDIEQELMRKFIDDLDNISPDKVADYLIEREKSRQRTGRAVPTRGKGDEPPVGGADDMAAFGRKIGQAVGARPTRTAMRFRAVRGGRA